MEQLQSVAWRDGGVRVLDQRLLPQHEVVNTYTTVADVAESIRSMQVRGAPAIGCTAAYGMALVAVHGHGATEQLTLLPALAAARVTLDASRPTAVNLFGRRGACMTMRWRIKRCHWLISGMRCCRKPRLFLLKIRPCVWRLGVMARH
jgi:methylthioribose-1-phosphate isomerase